ncbi:MAG TPA: Xaa-Pro peptidase family protein [Niallia sp.]|nr:Xaa-Pro peptidase family protein [Niallia sp.]
MLYQNRIEKAQGILEELELDALLVTSPTNFFYFSGTWLDSHERLQAILINKVGQPIMVIHEMSKEEIDHPSLFKTVLWKDGDQSIQILEKLLPRAGVISIDNQWPSQNLINLMKMNNNMTFVDSTSVIGKLRVKKDKHEIELLKKSGAIANDVMGKTIDFIKAGMTESEVVNEIKRLFKTHNVEKMSFNPIVGAGKNGAIPHHSPDDTKISNGDMVVIDLGGIKDHYCSDITRTILIGDHISEEMKEVYNTVLVAQEEAIKAIRPGISLKEIDKVARDIITEAGYGPQFTHRTGHGLGIEVHEEPFVTFNNDQLLEEGMVISVEPGIYLSDQFGVRIEDIVVVTETGFECINHYPRELIVKE